jgi:hypothetical protein
MGRQWEIKCENVFIIIRRLLMWNLREEKTLNEASRNMMVILNITFRSGN